MCALVVRCIAARMLILQYIFECTRSIICAVPLLPPSESLSLFLSSHFFFFYMSFCGTDNSALDRCKIHTEEGAKRRQSIWRRTRQHKAERVRMKERWGERVTLTIEIVIYLSRRHECVTRIFLLPQFHLPASFVV